MNRILRILITIIFCFSQIGEVNANLGRDKSQERGFGVMVLQKQGPYFQAIKRTFVGIAGQFSEKNGGVFLVSIVDKTVFVAIVVALGAVAFKSARFIRKWIADAIYRALTNKQNSLYHD
ncbi:hypothetical protein [Bartonella rattaustraliani]|uniref:hypothetical protein n=1 Tax=Bartonella rattaustraliani TaxID=481139 RepID=UPI00036C82BA|nr:hypothetical protein [Bartonella rattaustraliani]